MDPSLHKTLGLESRSVHALELDSHHRHHAPTPLDVPIYATSTYRLASADHAARLCDDNHSGPEATYLYSRYDNPTTHSVAKHLAALENGAHGQVTSSGMAAVNAVFFTFLKAGDHLVLPHNVYGGTHSVASEMLPGLGIQVTFVRKIPLDDLSIASFKNAIRSNTKLLYAETPSNPNLRMVDLEALAALGREHNVVTAVDSTFASPYLQTPITLGIDIVIHSATKYIAGHSDLIAGVVVARTKELYSLIENRLRLLGGVISPHDAFMVERGLKTLPLRMRAHCENAMAIAKFLEAHPKVAHVLYPGLASHPDHALAVKQMKNGFGGMISFDVKGGVAEGKKLIESVKVITFAVSLGGVESLISHPASTTHSHIAREARIASGISDGLVRLSVGTESVEDLIRDLTQALDLC